MQIAVRDLMQRHPPVIRTDSSLNEMTELILVHKAEEVLVVNDSGRLLGIVTDYDLLKLHLATARQDVVAADIMCANVAIVDADAFVDDVAHAFRSACFRRAAVLERGRLVGQLLRRDVLWTLSTVNRISMQRRDELLAEATGDAVQADSHPHIPRPRFLGPENRAAGTRTRAAERLRGLAAHE